MNNNIKKSNDSLSVILAELMSNDGLFSDYLNYVDENDRRFFLTDEVCQESVDSLVKSIIRINVEDIEVKKEDRKPITIYISSVGGYVDAGMQLIDIIMNSITPVHTVNMGCNYSMALLIGLAGVKRYAMPNSKYLMHDGSAMIGDSMAKLQDQIEFYKSHDERIKQYIISRTKLTKEKYDEKYRFEWYFFADEAKKYGFTDGIIGEDIQMEELLR